MEDKSSYTSQRHTISEGLQNFIDSMVEEIVVEGKPFVNQKKYLKKYSENEGLNYDKLEADIVTFIEILDSLKTVLSNLQVRLAEEKGRECYISDDIIKKLVAHSSKPNPTGILETKSPSKYIIMGCLGLFVLFSLVLFYIHNTSNSRLALSPQSNIKRDTVVVVKYSTEGEQKYRADAEKGVARAQFNLGYDYYYGEEGLPQSYSEAIKWYSKAANQGHAAAQNNLGLCYEKGNGVQQDYAQAIEWYKKALSNGSSKAQSNLERVERLAQKDNGHEWVDLGLGVKWATCNIGASSPGEYGDFYAWGEKKIKSNYNWASYAFTASGDTYETVVLSKYETKSSSLELNDDVAREKWGGKWRVPTKENYDELLANCTFTWTSTNGINGYKVISKKNGRSIFLPAAGGKDQSSHHNPGSLGNYWSSSSSVSEFRHTAWGLFFNASQCNMGSFRRNYGLCVRPVTD